MIPDQVDPEIVGNRNVFPGQESFQGTEVEFKNSFERRVSGVLGIEKIQSRLQQDVIFLTILFSHRITPSGKAAGPQDAKRKRAPEKETEPRPTSESFRQPVSSHPEDPPKFFGRDGGAPARP